MFQYVVSSPIRTGSNYLVRLLQACNVVAIKTHDPQLVVHYPVSVLILLSRRDKFASVMSGVIWHKTRESVVYSNKHIEPFAAELDEFAHIYGTQRNYERNHDFSRPYVDVVRFEFEDILNNNDIVFEKLNLQPVKSKMNLSPKSPYNYQKLITNLEQCRHWFDLFESHDEAIPADQLFLLEKGN